MQKIDIQDILSVIEKLKTDERFVSEVKQQLIDSKELQDKALTFILYHIKNSMLEEIFEIDTHSYYTYDDAYKITQSIERNYAQHFKGYQSKFANLVTGIDESITKKSLDLLRRDVVDDLFEAADIKKRVILKERLFIGQDNLNDFTLKLVETSVKDKSLTSTDLEYMFGSSKEYKFNIFWGASLKFSKKWSDVLLKKVKLNMSTYKFIYLNTLKDSDANIFDVFITVGDERFDTPFENFYRDTKSERYDLSVTQKDFDKTPTSVLLKALMLLYSKSELYIKIVKELKSRKEPIAEDLYSYISNLTQITEDIRNENI